MIGLPLNDYACLGPATELVAELVRTRDPVLVAKARELGTTAAIAPYIRSKPQRDDTGDPADGPRVSECEPSQRLRIPADDPNCFERVFEAMALWALLDPKAHLQVATIRTPAGPHTMLVVDGKPVVLDPNVPRNALEAGLFQIEGTAPSMTPEEQIDWIAGIAEEPASFHRNGLRRVSNARRAMHGALGGRPVAPKELPDVAFVLTLAEREARLFGARGVAVHRAVQSALGAAELAAHARPTSGTRNARRGFRIGRYRVRPDWGTLGAVARASGRVGARAAAVAAQTALARYGVPPALLDEIERELNREGLSLGPLARASKDQPVFGSLVALAAGGAK